jgi:hypothetical protein
MSRDSLDALLEQTDATFPPPQAMAGLVERLQARAARQARMRVALAAIGAVTLAAMILHSMRSRPAMVRENDAAPHTITQVEQWRAEISALEATASLHEKAAEDLLAVEKHDEASGERQFRAIQDPDPLSYLPSARERAARIMLMDADRHEATAEGIVRAEETYRRAARLFPETAAAREAAARLSAAGV